MALSDDQRALLRLLAQREEGYEDIAALKGMSVDEVRAEVREALAELQAAGEAPPTPPAQAPPEPEPEPKREPEPARAGPPEPPAAPAQAPPPKPPSTAPRGLPVERRRLLLVSGGALAIVAAVLIAIAALGGDSGSGSSSPNGSNAETAAAEEGEVTQAVLTAADGSDAGGRAIFGRLGKEEIVLQITAEGLEPTTKGEPYMVWLYRTKKLSLRIGNARAGEDGRLAARFAIPAELLAYVASGAFDKVYVSRTSSAAYQSEVRRAKRTNGLPRYTGETVLTGKITGPIAKAGAEGG